MSDHQPKFGVLARAQAAWDMFRTGQTPGWFGPAQPMPPQAPPQEAGRRFDYPSSINLNSRPRADEEISHAALRALAENYDLLRLVIETRKDQAVDQKWSLRAREGFTADKARIKAASEFLERPDKEHDFDQWSRMLLEDMFVIDAATVYPRQSLGGQLYALDPIDGATIKRVVDEYGRTPLPPFPAYQQILHGIPATDYTAEELLYLMRNPRTHKLYGMSQVQQVVLTVNTGLRRAMHKLNYYTEGTVPDALCGVPDNWTTDQISEFQEYFDALLTDNTAERRKMRFVPGGIAKGFIQTKAEALKDEFDEWLARVVCYAFSVSNQWAVKQMNRSTSETAQEQATDEAQAPTLKWVRSTINRCLRGPMGYPELELQWEEQRQADPKELADTARVYMSFAGMTINEARDKIGLDPLEGGDTPLIITATGATPLADVLEPPPPPPPVVAPPGAPQGAQEPPQRPGGQQTETEAMVKRASPEARLRSAWADWFRQEAPVISRMLVRLLPEDTVMQKAAGDPPDNQAQDDAAAIAEAEQVASVVPPSRAAHDLTNAAIDAIASAVRAADWPAIEAATVDVLREVAEQGAEAGVAQAQPYTAGIAVRGAQAATAAGQPAAAAQTGGWSTTSQNLATAQATKLANPRAVAWAEEHAAKLVSGVDDATRNMLRKLVVQAVAEGRGSGWLQKQIETSAAFDEERAQLIARNEVRTAYNQANLIGMQEMQKRFGVPMFKRLLLGPNENHCAVCLACVLEGAIPVDEDFVAGSAPPFHPRCECTLTSASAPKPKLVAEAVEPPK